MKLPFLGYHILIRFAILGTIALFFGRGVGVVSAEIVHQVRLVQGPKIIVWQGQADPITAQSVTLKTESPYAMAAAPLAGQLEPIQALGRADIGITAQKTFRVASNAPFAIRAEAAFGPNQADTPIEFGVTAIGANAQHPGQTGQIVPSLTFGDLAAPQLIYQAERRTALRRGSTASQAVEFTATWPTAQAADVTFTVYVP